MSGVSSFGFSLPKRFSALVFSLILGLFWVVSPASLAAAGTHSPSAPLKAESRPRVVARVLEVSPRVWRQGQDANVTLTLQLSNNSPSFIHTPQLKVDLTKQPLPESAQWKQWLSGTGTNASADSASGSLESLANVQLPSLFAFAQAEVKVNLPAKRLQELTKSAGIYGIKSSLSVRALSNVSGSAKQTRQQVNQFRKSEGSQQPPELGFRNEHFGFYPKLPLDTHAHPDGKYVGDTYRANSFSLLPVLPNKRVEVPVTLFAELGLAPDELSEEIPAVPAANRSQAVITAAQEADLNLLVDPALLDYTPKLLPSPKEIHNYLGWNAEQIFNPAKNPEDDSADTDKSQLSSKQSSVEPETVEASGELPAKTGTSEAVTTPESSPEQQVEAVTRMRVLQTAHLLSQLNSDNLAILPWGAPDLSAFMHSKLNGKTLTSRSLAHQAEWAQLFQQVQVAAGNKSSQAPMQLVKLNDFKVLSDPQKQLSEMLKAGDSNRHLLLTNHQLPSPAVSSAGKFSDLPAGSSSALVEDLDASEALQGAVSDSANAGVNPAQLFLANLANHAINGQNLMLRVPSDPAAISRSKAFLTNIGKQQNWVSTQNLRKLLSGAEGDQSELQIPTLKRDDAKPSQPKTLERADQLVSRKLKQLSGVATILETPAQLLDPAVDTAILQFRQPAPSESKILEWAGSLDPWWQPLSVNPPENVLMIYGESTLPVSVQNPLPWAVTVSLQATTDSPRLQSKNPTKAKISPNSGGSVDLKLNGVGSGDIRTEVKLVSAAQTQVSPSESLVVRVRANWETRGLFVVGGIAAAVFIFGLVRRIRQGRRTQSFNLSDTKQFHNA